jgi:muramoyltetrapeptide carboxypeptidase LdcA involved in peptidoglycan recycling
MNFIKPNRLKKGDTVAIVSPSWGGPSVYPHVYENGLKVLEDWGLSIKEYPTTRETQEFLSQNPRARARDLNEAFADKDVKAIFASIGGEDSIRILPFLDKQVIYNNPKIFLGYSDSTTIHVFCNLLGLTSFHGPSIMGGFSQLASLPTSYSSHIKEFLFEPKDCYDYEPYNHYSEGYPDWKDLSNLGKVNELATNSGYSVIQGSGNVKGELFGGCIEVLEFLKGTDFWPDKEFWHNKILFFETSEHKPPIHNIAYMLRNYGVQGVFNKCVAVLFGRARDYSSEEKDLLNNTIKNIVGNEFEKPDLPIITNLDFGHTDPQHILPLGVLSEVDCTTKKLRLLEPWL